MYFAMEPELLWVEKMMTSVPNFAPFWGVRVYDTTEAPIRGTHDELMRKTMQYVRNLAFRKRYSEYCRERKDIAMTYRGDRHEHLFIRELQKRENPTAAMLCALYLLTADCRLWSRVRQNVHAKGIQFHGLILGDITPEAYTLFMATKDLYCGTKHITVSDLADKEIVSPKMFGVLCEAMALRRYGMAVCGEADRRQGHE